MNDHVITNLELLETGAKFVLLNVPIFFAGFNVRTHIKIVEKFKNSPLHFLKFPKMTVRNVSYVSKVRFNEEVGVCLDEFVDVFRDKKHIDLNNFYNNIWQASIGQEKLHTLFSKKIGEYDICRKALKYDGPIRRAIFHELLHLASSREYNDRVFSGFEHVQFADNGNIIYDIGEGLTEGHTTFDDQIFREQRYLSKWLPYFRKDRILFRSISRSRKDGELLFQI